MARGQPTTPRMRLRIVDLIRAILTHGPQSIPELLPRFPHLDRKKIHEALSYAISMRLLVRDGSTFPATYRSAPDASKAGLSLRYDKDRPHRRVLPRRAGKRPGHLPEDLSPQPGPGAGLE